MPRSLDESAGDLITAMGQAARRSQGPMAFALGEVTAGTQEGLRVQCGGTELTAEDLRVNEALLTGYCPQLSGTLHGSCTGGGSCTVPVDREDLARARFALVAGDQVVLLTQDEQVYYLLCKVVPLV